MKETMRNLFALLGLGVFTIMVFAGLAIAVQGCAVTPDGRKKIDCDQLKYIPEADIADALVHRCNKEKKALIQEGLKHLGKGKKDLTDKIRGE